MANALESYLRGAPPHHRDLLVNLGIFDFLLEGLFDEGEQCFPAAHWYNTELF